MLPSTLFDLTGKTALVTGGATGIGKMAATGLAAAGAKVFIASRKGEDCRKTAAGINALNFPGSVEGFAADIATQTGIEALINDVQKRTAGLNILLNNAGRSWGAPLGAFPHDAWGKVLDLNVTGMFYLTQGLIEILAASAQPEDPSRVINLGSVMGEIPMGDQAYSYSVSKAGVHHMTKILAKELGPRRITVNALAPGPFQSGMTKFALGEDKGSARVAARVPAGRLGRPEDIAGAIQFLCGAGGAYVTGAILPLSGGINIATGPSIFGED